MKAAVLYADLDIRYEEHPMPDITHGEVLVRVMAAGICGSDVPRALKSGAHYYPIVLGHEFSGIVEQVGEGISDLKKGDHVAGVPLLPCMECADCKLGNFSQCKRYSFIGSRKQGAFSDYVALPRANVIKISPDIPFEQAAMFEPCTVAAHGVMLAGFSGGKSTAILGCGTIGLFALQWVKAFGAKSIAVFDIDPDRLELAKQLGADFCINTLDPEYKQSALEATNGRGFEFVFETAGAAATAYMAFELAANKASVCYIGTPSGELRFSRELWENLNRKELLLTGSWMSCTAPFPGKAWSLTAQYLADGRIKCDSRMIHAVFPMSKAQEAFELYTNPAKVKGRVILSNM